MTRDEAPLREMHAAIRRYALLEHPFYLAWSRGALPVAALETYAREYGAFIRVLDRGWRVLGEPESAAIERGHVALWDAFAGALGTAVVDVPAVGSVQALVDEAARSFTAPAAAAGALYAFEVQQPKTARSKLEGLDTHYAALPPGVRPYFEAHACESGEDTLLEKKLAEMPEAEQQHAVAACERMSKALWDALTGLHSSCRSG